jgi:hypothetical protein
MEKKSISLDSIIKQSGKLITSNLDGEIVMLSVENGKYYGMDDIGSRIWELIAAPLKVSKLIDLLVEEFDVERKRCESDVLTFLNAQYRENVIELSMES